MAFQVKFYFQYRKSPNSTALPQSPPVQVLEMDVVLKNGSSVLSPTLQLYFSENDWPWNYTFCYIEKFQNRYYFVDDWVNIQGTLWECRLSIDVLGTWKSFIGNTEQFIERSASAWDSNIPDKLVVGLSTISTTVAQRSSPWNPTTGECYIVEIVGGNSSVYYVLSRGEFTQFLGQLFSDNYADTVFPTWADVYPELKTQLNPMQYIGSVRFYPYSIPPDAYVDSIDVGWGFVDVSAGIITSTGYTVTWIYDFTAPTHPDASTYNFVQNAPYSEYELYIPPFGTMPLDSGVIAQNKAVNAYIKMDIASGMGNLKVYGAGGLLGEANSQIGIDVKVGQTYNTPPGIANMVTSGLSLVSDIAAGNIADVVTKGLSTVGNMLGNATPKLRTSGSNGSFASIDQYMQIQGRFQRVKGPDVARVGRLLYAKRLPNTLSGYIKCVDAHIEIPGLNAEAEKIENFLNGGFYFE